MLLDTSGVVYAFGDNRHGQLGICDTRVSRSFIPMKVAMVERAKCMAAGDAHSLVVSEDQSVWSWGLNASGQLGHGNFVPQAAPTRITTLVGIPGFDALSCGGQHSVIVGDGGKAVFSWGSNNCGQLGIGKTSVSESAPIRVALNSHQIVQVAAAASHTMMLDKTGELLVCGDNSSGQLALPERTRSNPELTSVGSLRGYKINFVATADKHSICLAIQ